MATLTEPRISPEALLNIMDRPMPELVDGQLVEREMSQESDMVGGRILRILGNFLDEHPLGYLNVAQGSYQIFPDDPDRVRIPEVSFTRRDRFAPSGPSRGHARVAPDLVVEVISPNDLVVQLKAKIEEYRSAGVPLLWIVDPDSRTVDVLGGDRTAITLRSDDWIDGGAVLPGFRCQVKSFFKDLIDFEGA